MDCKILLQKKLNVFFIGIGGISMSGLAKLLFHQGHIVSGSDKQKSSQTKELEELGIKVFYSHEAKNVKSADLVVFSSAISSDNPELNQAINDKKIVVSRSELLGAVLSRYKRSVAISGCHGKTTATAMLGEIMKLAGENPTIFLGGEYGDNGNFLMGKSDLAIAEACEYKKSFLDINTKIAVVLNVDNDHLDSYDGMQDIVYSFKKFVGEKLAVINADEKYVNELSNDTTVTFGIDNVATYFARDINQTANGVSFTACAYAKPCGRIKLQINGKHNVYNALSAFATADLLGVPFSVIRKGLESFKGVKRRNELLGKMNGLNCFADYAHHPSEIKATLSSFRLGGSDFITVFQPHTYSRTKNLMQEFVKAFNGLDNLIVYKTYPAREKYDQKGSARTLAEKIGEQMPTCRYAHTIKELQCEIERLTSKNRRILFLGAGDIYQIAKSLMRKSTSQ
jgi:UDP-N-acetylmuramate--alanine ligase